jgi:hypothetical protein
MVRSVQSMHSLRSIPGESMQLRQIAVDLIVNCSEKMRDARSVHRVLPLGSSRRQSEIPVRCLKSSRAGAGEPRHDRAHAFAKPGS